MFPLFPTRKIMKTIKTNTWKDIIFRQVISDLDMRSLRSYQLHEFEYEMLAGHIGGPECHEVWRQQASPGVTVATGGVTLH